MKITVNGDGKELADVRTLADALSCLGYGEAGFAVALNREFVPRTAYDQTEVRDGDELEVVAPIQGG